MVVKQTSFENSSVHKGNKAEDVIARILRQEGYFVVITADYEERGLPGAPGMRNKDDFLIMPDIFASARGCTSWAEVKGKTKPTYTRLTRQYEHGVPLVNFNHYKEIQTQTGLPVSLFIYEFASGDVLYNPISELESVSRIYEGNKMSQGGMIFFPRIKFSFWGRVAILEDSQYDQLSLLDSPRLSQEEGGKLFQVFRR